MRKSFSLIAAEIVGLCSVVILPGLRTAEAGGANPYQVLAPIHHGNLTIFPVVSTNAHDTRQFLTLDEGLRSGEVIVTEAGSISPLIRPRHGQPMWQESHHYDGAEVNRLVLVNNSKKPLLLLAGEIVTGGKQDRIIGKDRLVPAESDPIDLSVFCVEPGRWVGPSAKFAAPAAIGGGAMGGIVQPSVRGKAMADKNQQQVWDEVGKSRTAMAESVEVQAAPEVAATSSYAGVMQNRAVLGKIDSVAAPTQHDYQSMIGHLRENNAVGVVVAVNGELVWADIFASSNLLEKYWPKLVRSYAAEAVVQHAKSVSLEVKAAQDFLDRVNGHREVVENEPGLYRHSEITGDGYRVFELTSLLPNTGFDLHLAKMAE